MSLRKRRGSRWASIRPTSPLARIVGYDAVTVNPDRSHSFDSIGRTIDGYVEIIPVPSDQRLAALTRQAKANLPTPDRTVTPADRREGEAAFRQIKHVVYIIRENRT